MIYVFQHHFINIFSLFIRIQIKVWFLLWCDWSSYDLSSCSSNFFLRSSFSCLIFSKDSIAVWVWSIWYMEFPISVIFLHCSAAVFDYFFPSTSKITFRLSNKFDQVIVLLVSCCPAIGLNTVHSLSLMNTITSGEWFNLRMSPAFIGH